MKSQHIIDGPGIHILLDKDEIFPNDPGQGTPVLVVWDNGNSGTWNCVTTEGENSDGDKLTEEQSEWIEEVTEEVEQWMEENGI